MPTYQYACTDCGDQLEVVQSFTDDSLTECPTCQTGRLRKLFGSVGVVFKGSGFYRTDSRGSAGGPAKTSQDSSSTATKDTKTSSTSTTTSTPTATTAAAAAPAS